ncbi:MAG: sugar transferase [Clostridia bacterium]|nr:sugar transferase [Clostridia bacterium]
MYPRFVKRALDIICAALALTLLSWLIALVALLVRIKLGGPVIFRQERPGRIDKKTGRERLFTLYKFRTMTDARDENGELLPDSVRLTRFGRLLRSTSLDELPELVNILRGDMSVIGPRPLLVEYLPLYSEEQRRRHDVRPGLSGYAQVNGRNALSWDERFKLDVWYTRNISFLLDLRIVLKTIYTAFKREGISSDTNVTMEKFVGNEDTGLNS